MSSGASPAQSPPTRNSAAARAMSASMLLARRARRAALPSGPTHRTVPSLLRIGVAHYSVASDEINGRKIWRFGMHLFAAGVGRLATNIGIAFVEHEHGNLVFSGEHSLQGQHHAGQFTRGGDGAQRARGLARVGCELEFDGVQALLRET